MKLPVLLAITVLGASFASADEAYRIDTVPFPEDVPPEVGALGFTPSGKLVVALRRSDILIAKPSEDPNGFEWHVFARGMHNICGMEVISESEMIVSQMPELTRVRDTDGDGTADVYESIASPWGMSGNYHETNHLVPDGKGGWFVAAGTASHNGPVFYHTRGEYSRIGRRGRNFSASPWKGWILHIDAEGTSTPWASGFRMHNGILLDSKGDLWAGDNQGDWRGTTPFYHIEKGHFYGHPSSLVWDPERNPNEDPLKLPIETIDELRTRAAILLPHEEMNRSASEPIEIPDNEIFGPYGGQILLPDNNGDRISRLMLEEVGGAYQGACTQFYEGNGLRLGNNRVVFSPDGKTLFVGQTSRGWGPLAEGLQRITYTGKDVFDGLHMSLTKTGFRVEFTQPVESESIKPEHFTFRRYRYADTSEYGGDKLDVAPVEVKSVQADGESSVVITIEGIEAGGWIYEMTLGDVKSSSGASPRAKLYCYTVNALVE